MQIYNENMISACNVIATIDLVIVKTQLNKHLA